MAAPTLVAATGMHDGITANIGTFTWTIPATAQAGDVAVIVVGMNASAANPFLTPSGWTPIGSVLNTSSNHNTQAFGRVLGAGEGGTTVSASLTTTAAGKIHGGGIVIRGAEGIPTNFATATDTTTGATVAGTTITTDSADNLIVAVGMLRNTVATSQSTSTVSSGWTERTDTGTANSVAPNFTASIATRDATVAASGTAVTGPTFTSSDTASTGHVWQFAFEPSNNTAPTCNAGPDQTGVEPYTTVTLTFSATDTDGTIVAYTVTQTAGTTVTRTSIAVNQRQFKAPGTIAGETLTFSVTATDNGGAVSAPDTVNITVLPVTERAAVGTGLVPLEIRVP